MLLSSLILTHIQIYILSLSKLCSLNFFYNMSINISANFSSNSEVINNVINTAYSVLYQCELTALYMLIGWLCYQNKWLSKKGIKDGINIILYIVCPAVIIDAFAKQSFSREQLAIMLLTCFLAFIPHFLALPLALGAFNKEKRTVRTVLTFGTVFSNNGYFAIPLLQVIGGSEAVFYGSIYIAVFNLLQWSLGLKIMNKSANISWQKLLINPGIISLFIGSLLFLSRLKMPTLIASCVNSISLMNSPLAMLLVGAQIAAYAVNIRDTIRQKQLWLCVVLRLLAVPFIFLLILLLFRKFLPISKILALSMLIPSSAPVAGNTVLFAELFEENVKLAAEVVTVSTILSALTITGFVSLFELLS